MTPSGRGPMCKKNKRQECFQASHRFASSSGDGSQGELSLGQKLREGSAELLTFIPCWTYRKAGGGTTEGSPLGRPERVERGSKREVGTSEGRILQGHGEVTGRDAQLLSSSLSLRFSFTVSGCYFYNQGEGRWAFHLVL